MDRKEAVGGLQGLKGLQVGNDLEGLGGIELALDASHDYINIIKGSLTLTLVASSSSIIIHQAMRYNYSE